MTLCSAVCKGNCLSFGHKHPLTQKRGMGDVFPCFTEEFSWKFVLSKSVLYILWICCRVYMVLRSICADKSDTQKNIKHPLTCVRHFFLTFLFFWICSGKVSLGKEAICLNRVVNDCLQCRYYHKGAYPNSLQLIKPLLRPLQHFTWF